jgi:hypothetical protein
MSTFNSIRESQGTVDLKQPAIVALSDDQLANVSGGVAEECHVENGELVCKSCTEPTSKP